MRAQQAGRQAGKGPRCIYFVSQIPALTAFDGAGARYENQRRSDEELFPVFARINNDDKAADEYMIYARRLFPYLKEVTTDRPTAVFPLPKSK